MTKDLRRYSLFFILSLGLIFYCLGFVDTEVALETQFLRKNYYVILKIVSILISPPTLLIASSLLFLWAFLIKKSKELTKHYFPLVSGLYFSNAFIRILKVVIGRSRPDQFLAENIYQFKWFTFDRLFSSIPSGHATTIGAFAGFFACAYPRHALTIVLFSFLASLSRVYIGAHFLSDILVGVFVGLFFSWVCYYKLRADSYLDYIGE